MDIRRRSTATRRFMAPLLTAACLLLGSLPGVRAEDGGGHPAAPRIALEFESSSVVVIAAQGRLYAYVDRTVDNGPIAGAEVVIATPHASLVMGEIAPGLYRSAPFRPSTAVTPLQVSVAAGGMTERGAADLLLPSVPEAAAPGHSRTMAWLGVAAALLLALLWLRWHSVAAWWRPTGRAA